MDCPTCNRRIEKGLEAEKKYKYLRRVLSIIIKNRRWRNGYLIDLAKEAVRRTGG
jgi:hypothetical protein